MDGGRWTPATGACAERAGSTVGGIGQLLKRLLSQKPFPRCDERLGHASVVLMHKITLGIISVSRKRHYIATPGSEGRGRT